MRLTWRRNYLNERGHGNFVSVLFIESFIFGAPVPLLWWSLLCSFVPWFKMHMILYSLLSLCQDLEHNVVFLQSDAFDINFLINSNCHEVVNKWIGCPRLSRGWDLAPVDSVGIIDICQLTTCLVTSREHHGLRQLVCPIDVVLSDVNHGPGLGPEVASIHWKTHTVRTKQQGRFYRYCCLVWWRSKRCLASVFCFKPNREKVTMSIGGLCFHLFNSKRQARPMASCSMK